MNRSFHTAQETRNKNKREERRLLLHLESGAGIGSFHKSEIKGITKEQKRIQRELEKIKTGYYKKVKPHETSGFSHPTNSSRANDRRRSLPLDVKELSHSARKAGGSSSLSVEDETDLLCFASDERQQRNYQLQSQLGQDSKRLQEKVRQFNRHDNNSKAEISNSKSMQETISIENSVNQTATSFAEINLHNAKDSISKRLLNKNTTNQPKKSLLKPTKSLTPLPGDNKQNSDTSQNIEQKSSVEEFLLNPVFDSNLYNPDGRLRTMYTMPPIEQRFNQAKKARYIRGPTELEENNSLTVDEIFSHR